jgi:hypothetical protein
VKKLRHGGTAAAVDLAVEAEREKLAVGKKLKVVALDIDDNRRALREAVEHGGRAHSSARSSADVGEVLKREVANLDSRVELRWFRVALGDRPHAPRNRDVGGEDLLARDEPSDDDGTLRQLEADAGADRFRAALTSFELSCGVPRRFDVASRREAARAVLDVESSAASRREVNVSIDDLGKAIETPAREIDARFEVVRLQPRNRPARGAAKLVE